MIDEHQAEDENGIVENLKDIVDEFKQVRRPLRHSMLGITSRS